MPVESGHAAGPDRTGVLLGVASSFLWSTTFISGRYLLREPAMIDPLSLVFCRFAIGGLATVALGSWLGKRFLRLPGRIQWHQVLLPAFFLFFLMSWMLFFGQQYTSATNASLLIEVSPVLIVIVWKFLRRHPVPGREWLAVAVGLVGALMVLGFITLHGFNAGSGKFLGDLAIFIGAISWVYGSWLAKRIIPPGKSLGVTAWMMTAAGLMVLPLLICNWHSVKLPTHAGGYLAILYMAIFPTALAFYCWNEAVARLELGLLTMIQFLTPVFTIILARLMLNESLTLMNLLGMVLVLAALAAASGRGKKRVKQGKKLCA